MGSKRRILLVEDEENFGAVLKNYLELSGYSVDLAKDGNVGLSRFNTNQFDLCILDVMMPYKDGFTLAGDIRKVNETIPIVFLTAKGEKEDQLKGYRSGADDYLTKPFDSEVLLLKLKSLFKRIGNTATISQHPLELGSFSFDPVKRILKNDGREERLSPKENQLLSLLCEYQNEVMPRTAALRKIWQNEDYFATRSMDVYIAKLRKRLKDDPRIDIENIHSEGFLFHVPV